MLEQDVRPYRLLTQRGGVGDKNQLIGKGITEASARSFLQRANEEGHLTPILASPDASAYQKAFAASQLGTGDFNTQEPNPPISLTMAPGLKYGIYVIDPNWKLCDKSEDRLERSLTDGAVIVIEPGLAVKFAGRLTAYCFRSFATEIGTFLEENWYSPVDPKLRNTLNIGFDHGVRHMQPPEGKWGLMRQYNGKLLPKLQTAINEIPEILPAQEGSSWREYRIKAKEDF